MPRDIELVKQELESSTTSIFITKWILEHTPYVFEDYETEYISWRHEIAEKLRIDARDIIITGSASLGFSLNPNKNFKSFDKKSDIDISIMLLLMGSNGFVLCLVLLLGIMKSQKMKALSGQRSPSRIYPKKIELISFPTNSLSGVCLTSLTKKYDPFFSESTRTMLRSISKSLGNPPTPGNLSKP